MQNWQKLEASLANIRKDSRYDKTSTNKHARLVAEESGWSQKGRRENIGIKFIYGSALRGITISFGFGEKSIEEQKAILYKGTVERMIMKYNTNSEEIAMIRNKEKFAKKYSEICFMGLVFLTESLRLRISEEDRGFYQFDLQTDILAPMGRC